MVKHKSVKEMMAERQPLARTSVEPINIYSTSPKAEVATPKQDIVVPQKPQTPVHKEPAVAHGETEPLRPYSTYLRKGQVKGIKLRAADREIKDMDIVQEAIDEYFKKHPL